MNGCFKGNLIYKENTFIERSIEALSNYNNISISLNKTQSVSPLNLPIIYDTYEDIGPISGIYAGLKSAKDEKLDELFVLACDYPNLTSDLVLYINEFNSKEYDAIILKDNQGRIHPLIGIYKTSTLPIIERFIGNKNYKIKNFLDQLNVKYVSLKYSCFKDTNLLKNINTLDDYNSLKLKNNQVLIAVSGAKNSGKTTIIEYLIKEFTSKNISVGVIKHDGHDFQLDTLGSDTDKHFKAGSKKVAIFSDSKYMFIEDSPKVALDKLLDLFKGYQLIILEGFKNSSFPKVEVVRKEVSSKPIANKDNLLFYATDLDLILNDSTLKSININNKKEIFYNIYKYFRSQDD